MQFVCNGFQVVLSAKHFFACFFGNGNKERLGRILTDASRKRNERFLNCGSSWKKISKCKDDEYVSEIHEARSMLLLFHEKMYLNGSLPTRIST